jgi:hypothetical protein
VEDSFYKQKVAVVTSGEYPLNEDTLTTPLGFWGSYRINYYYSFSKVNIRSPKKMIVKNGWVSGYKLKFFCDELQLKAFQNLPEGIISVEFHVYKNNHLIDWFPTNMMLSSITQKEQIIVADFSVKLTEGIYQAKFAIPSAVEGNPSQNSGIITLEVR